MRRRLLLIAGLTCAVAIAVLLRTAASDVEPAVAAESKAFDTSGVARVALDDCAIAVERTPGLASSEAAHPIPLAPFDATILTFVAAEDSHDSTPSLKLDIERPPQEHLLSQVTIRPPPSSHVA